MRAPRQWTAGQQRSIAPKSAEFELLKAAGYNAVRTSHNPPLPAFLDACDRLGLLVLDEAFDTWKANKVKYDYGRDFDEWWQRDISAMVLRDRNHLLDVLWSIGNEIPEVLVGEGSGIAKRLAEQVRSLDSSRPLTQAVPTSTSGPFPDAVLAVLDIAGYNYNLARNYGKRPSAGPLAAHDDDGIFPRRGVRAMATGERQSVHSRRFCLDRDGLPR